MLGSNPLQLQRKVNRSPLCSSSKWVYNSGRDEVWHDCKCYVPGNSTQEGICSAFGRNAGIVYVWYWAVERWPNGALKLRHCKIFLISHLSCIFLLIQFLHSVGWLFGCHSKVPHALCTLHREPRCIIQGFWILTSGLDASMLGIICDVSGFSPY